MSLSNRNARKYMREFRRRVNIFRQKLPGLLRKYPKQYVALRGSDVVGHDPNLKKLLSKVGGKYSAEEIYIDRVLSEPHETVDIDSVAI